MKFEPHDNLGPLVGMTAKAMRRQLNRRLLEGGHGVTAEQLIIMLHLWRRDGSTQQVIADICGKDKTSTARMIDTMERNGLVSRVQSKEDRRQNMIYLTDAGRTRHDELISLIEATHSQAEQGIPEVNLSVCKEVLRNVLGNLIASDPAWPGPEMNRVLNAADNKNTADQKTS